MRRYVVPIDGGLGSQMMQFALYKWLLEEGRYAQLDLSYFLINEADFDDVKEAYAFHGLSLFKWSLDYFGHKLEPQNHKEQLRLSEGDFTKLFKVSYSKLLKDKNFLENLFPSRLMEFGDSLSNLGLEEESLRESIVLHIRQGDFLNVSPFILTESYFIEAMTYIRDKLQIPIRNVLIVSDTEISNKYHPNLVYVLKSSFRAKVKMIRGMDTFLSHEIMRHCRVLVCSNSNFSFTAAMLRNMESIYPSRFYVGSSTPYNVFFKLAKGHEINL